MYLYQNTLNLQLKFLDEPSYRLCLLLHQTQTHPLNCGEGDCPFVNVPSISAIVDDNSCSSSGLLNIEKSSDIKKSLYDVLLNGLCRT